MMNQLLKVQNLYAGYGKMIILNSLNLNISKGEIVALVGTNGNGKTTLLRAISGLIKIKSGQIEFFNDKITDLSPDKRVLLGITLVPESREIFVRQSVLANLKLGAYLRLRRIGAEGYEKDLAFVLSIFPNLISRLKQLGGTLSGGEQQMLAIGRALMSRPKLLMLDEPSTGLSPLMVQEIFKVLKKLNLEINLSVFLIEQNTKLALRTAHRGYIVEKGRIVKSDDARVLLDYFSNAGLIYGQVSQIE
jgi:branched-chain amino acid transport system ATP-binding protein